jgi:hypothetical protein
VHKPVFNFNPRDQAALTQLIEKNCEFRLGAAQPLPPSPVYQLLTRNFAEIFARRMAIPVVSTLTMNRIKEGSKNAKLFESV